MAGFETGDSESQASVAIEGKDQFPKDAEGDQERWNVEMQRSEKWLRKFHKEAQLAVRRYLDERKGKGKNDTRLNLYTQSVDLKMGVLYDRPPQADVERRFMDAEDQVARVAKEILQRIINTDIERKSDTTQLAVEHALFDFKTAGFGCVRPVYVAKFRKGKGGKNEPALVKDYEDVNCKHHHWRDVRWSPCKTSMEMRWVAYAADMSKDMLEKRFGKMRAKEAMRGAAESEKGSENAVDVDTKKEDPWKRVRVWEIWDKDDEKVYWWVQGMKKILDKNEDPYGVEGFWPMPRFLMAYTSTSAYLPRPPWCIVEDLYEQVDRYSTRLDMLLDALRVTGLYDGQQPELKRLVEEGAPNELYPCNNWAMFAEKGGMSGVVAFFPLKEIAETADKLAEKRDALIALVNQLDGTSDAARGQQQDAGKSATATRVEARGAGWRMRVEQNKLAKFVSEYCSLKGEIVANLYDDATIIARTNIDRTPDAQTPGLIAAAIKLIRDEYACYRIKVQSDVMAMTDFDAIKSDRAEFMEGVAKFLSAAGPLLADPNWRPDLLEILKHFASGYRNAEDLESLLDRAIEKATQQAKKAQAAGPGADPAAMQMQLEQQKAQLEQQKMQMKMQLEQQKAQLKMQTDREHMVMEGEEERRRQEAELQANNAERAADFKYDVAGMQMKERLEEKRDVRHAQQQEQANAHATQEREASEAHRLDLEKRRQVAQQARAVVPVRKPGGGKR